MQLLTLLSTLLALKSLFVQCFCKKQKKETQYFDTFWFEGTIHAVHLFNNSVQIMMVPSILLWLKSLLCNFWCKNTKDTTRYYATFWELLHIAHLVEEIAHATHFLEEIFHLVQNYMSTKFMVSFPIIIMIILLTQTFETFSFLCKKEDPILPTYTKSRNTIDWDDQYDHDPEFQVIDLC